MFNKIIFLYKSNSSIFIILLFLFQKITNLFVKGKIKLEKKYFLNVISRLKISEININYQDDVVKYIL